MHLNTIGLDSGSSNSSANVVFGWVIRKSTPLTIFIYLAVVDLPSYANCNSCSTSQTGDLTKSDRAVDGIFGFGQQGLSIISQLSAQGIASDAFSHCLVGSDSGGGILVIGQIMEPNMVYTPLVPSQ